MPDSKPQIDVISAPIDKDITRPYLLPLLVPQDRVLNAKGGIGVQALEIYEKVLEDPQVSSCYQQRFKKLTCRPLEVTAASESKADQAAADWVRELLAQMPMDNITERMMTGIHYGYSVGEKMLTKDAKGLLTLDTTQGGIRVRNRRRFKFDRDMQPRLITLENMTEGEPIHPSRAWVMSFGGDNDDDPYGLGLGNVLYWLTLFKRGDMRHWLNYLERFANPSSKVEYPVGANDLEKKIALKLANDLKNGAAVAHTQGLVAELIESSKGTADFQGLYDRCDEAIAKVILSQSGTTDNGAWAGTAQTHENVANDIVASDGDMFSRSFMANVIEPLCHYNFENATPPKVFYKTTNDEDLNIRVERDKKLFDLGIRPTSQLIETVYGKDYEYLENQTILNGAQLSSLTQMITAASQKQIPVDSLEAMLIGTMGVDPETAKKIVAPIRKQAAKPQDSGTGDMGAAPQTPTQGQGESPPPETDLGALFAEESIDFAAKSKSCKKGVACGGSCISATKKCKKTMSATQAGYANAVTGTTATPETPPEQTPPPEQPQDREIGEPRKFNPDAIEDLEPEQFAEYLRNKEFLETQDEISNPSKLEVFNLIRAGFAPSDEDIANSKAKLTKADQQLLAENRAKIEEMRQSAIPIEKAFSAPLMTDEEAKGWKPILSTEEADKYVASSFTGKNEFYHGNDYERVIKSIEQNGLDPERNTRGIFGKGGYLATSKDVAGSYANGALAGGQDAGIVTIKTNIKNPLITDSENLSRMGSHFPGDQGNLVDSTAIHNYARATGYDSIYLKDMGYLITFDVRQSVVVNSEAIPAGSDRAQKIEEFWGDKSRWTIEAEQQISMATPSAQALSKAKDSGRTFNQAQEQEEW